MPIVFPKEYCDNLYMRAYYKYRPEDKKSYALYAQRIDAVSEVEIFNEDGELLKMVIPVDVPFEHENDFLSAVRKLCNPFEEIEGGVRLRDGIEYGVSLPFTGKQNKKN